MHIEYQVSEDDFVQAANLAMRVRSRFAKFWIYFPIAFGVFLIMTSLFVMITQRMDGMWPVMLWGSFLVLLPILRNFQFRRQYRKMPMLQDRRSLDADAAAVHFATASSEGRTGWQSYTKFAENAHTFVLFQQGNQIFIPIPKRELTSSQIDELRVLFETHLPSK